MKRILLSIIIFLTLLLISGCLPSEPLNQEEFEEQAIRGSIAGHAFENDLVQSDNCQRYVRYGCNDNGASVNVRTSTGVSFSLLNECYDNLMLHYSCSEGVLVRCEVECVDGCGNKSSCR
ncbi:MAG: hypothetical protein Q8Q01_01570 [archaeon]|nr:hypothetical protein [archaeon]